MIRLSVQWDSKERPQTASMKQPRIEVLEYYLSSPLFSPTLSTPIMTHRSAIPAPLNSLACRLQVRRLPRVVMSGDFHLPRGVVGGGSSVSGDQGFGYAS